MNNHARFEFERTLLTSLDSYKRFVYFFSETDANDTFMCLRNDKRDLIQLWKDTNDKGIHFAVQPQSVIRIYRQSAYKSKTIEGVGAR